MENDSTTSEGTTIGEFFCPVDPMDLLQCDSCQ